MYKCIDINADIGESFGAYKLGSDNQISKYISSANIATGFHAGDPNCMKETVTIANKNNLGIGAHPSYPDLVGFGRRPMTLPYADIYNLITYQIGALSAFTENHKLQHVKPHGALYNSAVKDDSIAEAIVNSIYDYDPNIIHVVLAGSKWEKIAKSRGVLVARECYADRAINSDGSLVSRNIKNSVIHDPIEVIERSLKLVIDQRVKTIDGDEIDFQADTICVHGDTKGSVELAKLIRNEMEKNSVEILKMKQILDS